VKTGWHPPFHAPRLQLGVWDGKIIVGFKVRIPWEKRERSSTYENAALCDIRSFPKVAGLRGSFDTDYATGFVAYDDQPLTLVISREVKRYDDYAIARDRGGIELDAQAGSPLSRLS
jgi:hypothetical protein